MNSAISRPRVLLIADACNPEWASVPLVGFNIYYALRRLADVTLVTQIRNRRALLGRMGHDEPITFIDSEAFAGPCNRLARLLTFGRGVGWTIKQAAMWLPYLYFERLVYNHYSDDLRSGRYDLIHRITPLSPTIPSPLATWTDVPFVLGPLNGGLPWPKGSTRARIAEMEWLSYIRPAYRAMPYVRRTYRRARCVIAASKYTLSALPREARRHAAYIPENGVDPDVFNDADRRPMSAQPVFRILFVGRLVAVKQVDLLIEAVATAPALHTGAELTIVGDGPELARLRELATRLGIARITRFPGWLAQQRLAELYRTSSVFVLPSIKEFGGSVVLEAMACGLPCIVTGYGGPAEYVTPETGISVPLGPAKQLVAGIRSHLEELSQRSDILQRYSLAAAEHVRKSYTWNAKAEQISGL